MKLTPLDLQQKSFRKLRLGGVDANEVDAFLELAASQLEELNRKVHQQDEELRRREARIGEYQNRESLLQQTLTTAQKLGDDMKQNSRKEAEIVLSDAELQAEKIIANAQAKRLQLIAEIEELKRAKAGFISQLTSLVDSHKAMLEAMKPGLEQSVPPAPRAEETGSPSSAAAEQRRRAAVKIDDNVSFLSPPNKREGQLK